MSNQNYEDGYFKLKKSNEDLTILIKKVLNDFNQTKLQLSSEKDKSSIMTKRNVSLENQLTEINNKCKEHQHELEDLRDEVASLKTYTKAVEGVAENYCGQNMVTESKYKQLKRKSTFLLTKLQVNESFSLSIDEPDAVLSPLSPVEHVPDLANVKKTYEDKLSKEKQKKEDLRKEVKGLRTELEEIKLKMNSLILQLEENSKEAANRSQEIEILSESYNVLKTDHEAMMQCFQPFQQMKSENLELKRTSSALLSEVDINGKMAQFSKILEDLKRENASLKFKINELESSTDATTLSIEISALKIELMEATAKISTLTHENRILKEQKGGLGIPPPPPPNMPPPPPQTKNLILKLFKGKQKVAVKAENLEERKVADMMKELQQRLEQKLRRERQMNDKEATLMRQETYDVSDSNSFKFPVKLRSNSTPNITPFTQPRTELEKTFRKIKQAPIKEDS